MTGCSADQPDPSGIEGLQLVEVTEQSSTERHTTERGSDYLTTPPAGGRHWPANAPDVAPGVLGWLRCGVYTAPVPSEFAVHSQEHGAVWLTYRPGATPADVTTFTGLAARDPAYVLVSPFPGQPGAWTASTWGAQLTVEAPDDPRLAEFVRVYAGGGQGGEKGADCVGGTLPDVAEAALAAAERKAAG
ncbi:MAG: DUF3105 domain-containing protein [Mycobacteriales bacterium]|nr:DUF3105 domain-containing protein [Mycobacteriales bacterium]